MADNPDEERDDAKLKEALSLLGEYFDSVQIFCTRCEMGTADGTVRAIRGSGNWYARVGLVHQWLEHITENERESARRSFSED